MKTSRDMKHDHLVATYQSIEASLLDQTLREHGIDDADARQSIIAGFLFQQGVFLDQCWFRSDGQKFYPGVYFATTPHSELEKGVVHLPAADFGLNFHEYAHGAAEAAVAGGEDIECGNDLEASDG